MVYTPTHHSQRFHTGQLAGMLLLIVCIRASAQTRETTFGVVSVIKTPGSFSHLIQLPTGPDLPAAFVLWNDSTHDLYIEHIDSTFLTLSTEHYVVREPFDDVLVANVGRQMKSGLILLNRQDRTIRIFPVLQGDTLDPASTLSLPFVPTGWQVGDINNDGRPDIVLYDRNNPGIVPFYENSRGTFVEGHKIAPDLPVGCLALAQLNDDNLTDLVVYDWVKSELHLLYGVGRGRFLDQSTFVVQGEVRRIIPTRLDPESNLDLVLVNEKPWEVQAWQGNGLGDFRLTKRSALSHGVVAYALGDVNDDNWTDFGYIDRSASLQLIFNNGSEWSQERVQFAAGENPVSVIFQDFNHDGKMDAVILDENGQSLRFLFSGQQANHLVDSLEFAAAPQPSGAEIHRSGFGAHNDLAVVNCQGHSLSLYTARNGEGLQGQTSFSLSVAPQFLTFHSLTDSSSRFVATSGEGDSLMFLSLNFKDSSSSYAVIPGEGSAEIIQTGASPEGQAEFFTFNTFHGNENPSIHYYERLNPGTFIEQTFRLGAPDVLLGATASAMNSDPYPDLVYVYRNADSGNVDLVVSFGDSALSYAQRHSTLELPRTTSAKAYLWTVRRHTSDTTSALLYLGDPSNTLYWVRGRGSAQFDTAVTILGNVRLTNRSMVRVIDADGDGFPDIVLNNGKQHEIGWLRGNPDGTFSPWKPLVSADSSEFFAVGDLNGDGIADLAVSLRKEGTVKIYNGLMIFVKKGNEAAQ